MTLAELAAARSFRDVMRQQLSRVDADVMVSVFVRYERHDCPKRDKSLFLELKEHYALSPEIVVHSDERGPAGVAFTDDGAGESWASPEGFGKDVIPARRFAFIWTQGKCSACGLTARSAAGRLVDPQVRPPAERALVSRG